MFASTQSKLRKGNKISTPFLRECSLHKAIKMAAIDHDENLRLTFASQSLQLKARIN